MIASNETLDALQFSVVCDLLAERTVTPMGRPLALDLRPLVSEGAILRALDETREALELLEAEGGLPLRGVGPVGEIFASIRREGSVLTGREVQTAARFCEVVEGARVFGRRVKGAFPDIGGRAAGLPQFGEINAAVAGKITPDGALMDAASPALGRIRARIQATTSALQAKLDAILARQDADTFLSDTFITERGGRFVIPVRSDAGGRVKGIVHGGSSSGATLFIEPLATVDLNNDLVRLREDEAEETERILRVWTEMLQGRLEELISASEEVARLDRDQAKGLLARDLKAVRPVFEAEGGLTLAAARHPLLEKTLAASGTRLVPVDLVIAPGTSTLIVSGPNAGGKTVVLKTAGLLGLMAHAGLFVPADEAKFPFLRRIFVDIGDHQSIEGSLSTFSAHIQNLAAMVRGLDPPCLILIDEIGTGTDPSEGGALAIALLEWLRTQGAMTVATTHHGPVKVYGIETPGVASASVEFDEKTLAPTYRLINGIAGVSAGLAIAERLGLDPRIIAGARARMDPGAREAEGHLLRLREMVAALEQDRKDLDRLRVQLESDTRKAREAAIRSDHERAERFRGELAAALEEFRAKARAGVSALEERKESIRLDKERVRREAELRREFERISKAAEPEEALPEGTSGAGSRARPGSGSSGSRTRGQPSGNAGGGGRVGAAGGPGWAGRAGGAGEAGRAGGPGGSGTIGGEDAPFVLEPGAKVLVGPFGREGKVESIENGAVTVLLGGARFRVRAEDCSPPGEPEPPPRWKVLGEAAAKRTIDKDDAPRELNLIGITVEEGLERLDKFLDDAFLAGHPEVRVIHGHGTGRLRNAIRALLSRHSQVVSHRPGSPNEGGDGATVATLHS